MYGKSNTGSKDDYLFEKTCINEMLLTYSRISTLLKRIDELITDDPIVKAKFLVDRHRGELLSRIFSRGKVINCDYRNKQVMVEIEAPRSFLKKIESQQLKNNNNFETNSN